MLIVIDSAGFSAW